MTAYALWLLKHRLPVIVLTLLLTAGLGWFAGGLKVVIDPATLAPQHHPYIAATRKVENAFGSKYLMLVGVSPRQGDVFQPAVLEAVQRITRGLEQSPGVVKATLMSLAAPNARAIRATAEGFEARPLLDRLPLTAADVDAMKAALRANPVYLDTIVSRDFRTAAILVELKERSDGFEKMVAPVLALVNAERSDALDITLGGNPVYLEQTERFSRRIEWLFPIAVLLIGLLHLEAFRSWQGLVLPLVTALLAVVWGMGFMGLMRQPMDIFNSPTPILILAVAAGHAVQLLKRYQEEYAAIRAAGGVDAVAANRQAVLQSLVSVGPVMAVAGGVAALGFFSLMVFDIATIRAFGLFTGLGILSAVVLEMSFIPAVRSCLRPPADQRAAGGPADRVWDRVPRWIAGQVLPVARRRRVLLVLFALVALCVVMALRIEVDNASRRFFAASLPIQQDDAFLNRQLGGTNSFYVMVEGTADDAIKSPELLRGLERLQGFAEAQPVVGKTLSIVDHLQRMNQAMHGDRPEARVLPASRELVSQYLLLYAMSGSPGDFDGLVDYPYRAAKLTILLKTGSNTAIKALVQALQAKAATLFGPGVTVTFGGDVTQTIALTDTMVRGKLLNIVQIGLAVLVISALAFRSLAAGLMVLAPLAFAVLAVFGVMGAFGIPLNIPNALISAMAVGIGADYAIYLLHRLREQVRRGDDADTAVRRALASAGQATLFVATAVAGGYAALALSLGYLVHQWLALFIVLAMVASALSALFLLPCLVLSARPRFVFEAAAPRARGWPRVLQWAAGLALTAAVSAFVGKAQAQVQVQVAVPAPVPVPSAAALMEQAAAASRLLDSSGEATFTLTHRDGATRVRKTAGQTKLRPNGRDTMRVVRFLAPADISGTATLLVEDSAGEDDLWVHLSALGRVRRLSAANKKDAFFGTDFSYGDVIGHKVADWSHSLLPDETIDGQLCHVVASVPVSDAVRLHSGYSRRVSWLRKDNLMPVRSAFWDLGGAPLKRLQFSDIRPVGHRGRWQAMRSSAENLQTGHRTTIEFTRFLAEQGVADELFTPQALDR